MKKFFAMICVLGAFGLSACNTTNKGFVDVEPPYGRTAGHEDTVEVQPVKSAEPVFEQKMNK